MNAETANRTELQRRLEDCLRMVVRNFHDESLIVITYPSTPALPPR